MLIGSISFRGDSIVLRDVDGSEQTLTFDDALQLHAWLSPRLHEIEERAQAAHERYLQAERDEEFPYRLAEPQASRFLCKQ